MARNLDFGVGIQHDNSYLGPIVLKRGFNYYVEIAKEAERNEMDTFYLPDHLMIPKNKVLFDTWTALAAIGMVTKKIKLGSTVTPVTLYRPFELAKRLTTVDHASGGRTRFVAGCGWHEPEYNAYDIPFLPLKERVLQMSEGIDVIKKLWTQDGPINFSGKYNNMNFAEFLPKPVQKPHPPIWFGGSSNAILQIVAKQGNGWIPAEMNPDAMVSKINILERYLKEVDRSLSDISIGHYCRIIIGEDSEIVTELMNSIGAKKEFTNAIGMPCEMMIGTPDQIVSQIETYVDNGVKYFCFAFQPPDLILESIRLFSKEVLPKFQSR